MSSTMTHFVHTEFYLWKANKHTHKIKTKKNCNVLTGLKECSWLSHWWIEWINFIGGSFYPVYLRLWIYDSLDDKTWCVQTRISYRWKYGYSTKIDPYQMWMNCQIFHAIWTSVCVYVRKRQKKTHRFKGVCETFETNGLDWCEN